MVHVKKEYKVAFVVLLILMSVAIGVLKTNIHKPTVKKVLAFEETKFLKKAFKEDGHQKKTKIAIASKNFSETMKNVRNLLSQNNVVEQNTELSSNSFQSLTEVPSENFNTLMSKLRDSGRLVSETSETFDILPIDETLIEQEIAIRTKENETLNKRLQSTRISDRERSNTGITIKNNFAIIDSLKNLPAVHKKNTENSLVQIFIKSEINSGNADVNKVVKFGKITLITFVGLIILSIFFYFVTVILLHLMNILGIRTQRKSSRYGYSYGSSKKSKRIYKNHKEKE